jgi:putative spermidine/putrescine transport system substrate-binding protein
MVYNNLSRRELLQRIGLPALTLPLTTLATSCTRHRDADQANIGFFGVGTLDLGKNWGQLTRGTGLHVEFRDNLNDVGHVITEMITMRAAHDYDVCGLLGGAEAELAQAKTILPWDLSKVPTYETLWPLARNIRSSRWHGQQYGIPIAVNADAMIYLPDKTRGTINSYHAVFDRKFKGRTSMEDSWMNSVIFTAIYLKESSQANIVDPSDLSLGELELVMEFLTKNKRDGQFLKFWSGWEEGVSLITSGDVWVMTGWEPIVYEAQRRGAKAAYARPTEGYEAWSTNLLLQVGAQDHRTIDAAHRFANLLLSGFYGCHLALERGYVVPNDQTLAYAEAHPDMFTQEQISHVRTTIQEVQAKFAGKNSNAYWLNVRPTNYHQYEDLWSKLRAS